VSNCEGKCDCNAPGGYPHDPDCRSLDQCDGERGMWCEKHWQEQLHIHGWLRHVPRHMVIDDEEAEEERNQELRDSDHEHLIDFPDQIDRARMRMKDELYDIAVISDERRNGK
jgi:hypothetical protein